MTSHLIAHSRALEAHDDQKKVFDMSDEELALRVSKDAAAFGVLMERYEGKLMSYIQRKSNVTRESAEDLLQESFLNAFRNINNFDARLSFSSWIYRIVHNQTISGWRKSSVRPEGHTVPVDDEFMARFQADGDIALDLDKEILGDHVQEVIIRMDEKYRNALILRYMEDKSYDEISDILRKPPGTVATYISRAKKQFKKLAQQHMQNLSTDI